MSKRTRSAGLMALLVCAAAAWGQPPQSPADAPYARAAFGELPAEFPLTIEGTQLLIDGVWVNGAGPFRFLLDTGAMGGGRIDSSLVQKLGLEPTGEVQASDGSARSGPILPEFRLQSLRLGALEFFDVPVISRDYNAHGAAVRGHIDGILGFHLFRELLLTIDYRGSRMRVERGSLPEVNGADILALDSESAIPSIVITIAGGEHAARIDTGSMGGIGVGAALADTLKFTSEPQQVGEARTVSGAFAISVATLDGDVRIGGLVIHQPELTIGEPIRHVNLGGRVLEDFALTFDQRSHRVRFTRPGDSLAEVPLETVMGRPVVAVSINGKGPFRFILDTGAGVTLLNADLVSELRLAATGKTRIGDPSNPTALEADTHVIDRLAVGGLQFEEVDAVSWDAEALWSGLGDVRGVLGITVFRDYLVAFSFPAQRLVISQGRLAPGDGSVALLGDDEIPTVELRVAGERVDAHIDTGNAGTLTLPLRLMDKVKLASEPMQAKARVASGEFSVSIATLGGSVAFAGQTLRDPQVHFTERFDWGNIGSGALADFVLTLDQANRRVRLQAQRDRTVADTPVQRKPQKRYGMMLAMTASGPIDVQGSIPGSVAEAAGLRKGDCIVAINGEDIESLDMARRGELLRGSPVTLRIQRGDEQLDIRMSLDDDAPAKAHSSVGWPDLRERMSGRFSIDARMWPDATADATAFSGLSAASACYDGVLRYARERRQFDRPIARFQLV